MVKPPTRKSSNKNPPILSHEFVIQNHADIVSCVAMVFVIGIMIQATSPIASIFIALQHNITEAGEIPMYEPGPRDWCSVFFYSLICIVIHAILQEYVLDKVSKRLHLSKLKLAIFSNSGQLATFYAISVLWGADIIVREHLVPEISLLWSEYPSPMSFSLKLFMIIQLSYAVHELPEIYFQRTKREEYISKIISAICKLVFVAVPYFAGFNKLLVCLVVFHQMSELARHITKLVHAIDREDRFGSLGGLVSNLLSVVARLATIVISVLTLWYGLALKEESGFNVLPVRLGLLGGICLLQAYLMFSFVKEQLEKIRESRSFNNEPKTNKPKKNKKQKEQPKEKSSKESDLPEVDQNTNKNLKSRAKAK